MAYPSFGGHRMNARCKRFLHVAMEIAYDTLELAPVVAFLFISSIPTESLAFVNNVEAASKPLVFARDNELANIAIVGIDAWPATKEWLQSTMSRIPDVTINISAGTSLRVIATAYSSDVSQTDANPWSTASGTRVHQGTLAANFLPFGSIVKIGSATYTVEDRLNARYNDKAIVDVWHTNKEAALQFGVQSVDLQIVSIPQS